jgi:hypothetical protein
LRLLAYELNISLLLDRRQRQKERQQKELTESPG